MITMEDLLRLAMELNRPDFTVQLRYSGHVNWIEIDCHPSGWKKACDCQRLKPVSIKFYDLTPDTITEACTWLRERSAEQEASNG